MSRAPGCGAPARACGTVRGTYRPTASGACLGSSSWHGRPADKATQRNREEASPTPSRRWPKPGGPRWMSSPDAHAEEGPARQGWRRRRHGRGAESGRSERGHNSFTPLQPKSDNHFGKWHNSVSQSATPTCCPCDVRRPILAAAALSGKSCSGRSSTWPGRPQAGAAAPARKAESPPPSAARDNRRAPGRIAP
jgi:hypothetical protein